MSDTEPPWRTTLRTVHLWLGLGLLVPLVVLSLTGSVLVFRPEIEDWSRPADQRAAGGPVRPVSEIVAAASAAAPGIHQLTMVILPEDAREPTAVRFQRRGPQAQGPSGMVQVLIDPATLTVFATSEPLGDNSLLRVMHRLHGSFMIGGGVGREIVGWLGVVMLVLGISGLVMWWPKPSRWRAAFRVSSEARGHRFHRELHGAIGIWAWVVFIIVSASGVYLSFPQVTGELVRTILPGRDLRAAVNAGTVEPIRGLQPIGIDEAAAVALAAVPDTRLWQVRVPLRADQPYRFGLLRPGHEHQQPAAQVAVDPYRRSIVSLLDPRAYSAGETVLAWQRAIHAGEGLGWGWKILVFLSGLLPVAFGATGFAMWLYRRRAKRRVNAWAS
jgi:uncharacterized iron-regulated membrane protein